MMRYDTGLLWQCQMGTSAGERHGSPILKIDVQRDFHSPGDLCHSMSVERPKFASDSFLVDRPDLPAVGYRVFAEPAFFL